MATLYRVPFSWGPINTLDRQAMETELNRLQGEIDEIDKQAGKTLFGDDHFNARNYQKWALPKVEWLKQLIETVNA